MNKYLYHHIVVLRRRQNSLPFVYIYTLKFPCKRNGRTHSQGWHSLKLFRDKPLNSDTLNGHIAKCLITETACRECNCLDDAENHKTRMLSKSYTKD
jgi:hypothetical protein